MKRDTCATYPPLNTLKPVTPDISIADGPVIRFGMPWLEMPFPTRMTIVRLDCGDLFVHSPTCLVPELKTEIEKMETSRWIIGPNRIRYWWIPEWRNAFSNAKVYLAPQIRERAGRHIDFDCFTLDKDTGYPWDAEIATLPIAGGFMAEFEFFHHASRTLILTDMTRSGSVMPDRSVSARGRTTRCGTEVCSGLSLSPFTALGSLTDCGASFSGKGRSISS